MSAKNYFRELLSFSRRDRIGVIALMVLIVLIYFLPVFFEKNEKVVVAEATEGRRQDTADRKQEAENWEKEDLRDYQFQPVQERNFSTGELFPFDPNTLSVAGWQRLGLSERTSRTIEKYRSKGGRFYRPEDLQRIWGLPDGFYERVKDFIVLPSPAYHRTQEPQQASHPAVEKKPLIVPINSADTTLWVDLPGIGNKLAARIIGFREKLGGFYSVDQIRETYGLPDSTFQKIRPYLQLDGAVKKFNLNTVTKEELKAHPYFRWRLANAIVEYRESHGPFTTVEELMRIGAVDELSFEKIRHYLILNPAP